VAFEEGTVAFALGPELRIVSSAGETKQDAPHSGRRRYYRAARDRRGQLDLARDIERVVSRAMIGSG
jgi:hypothetical protein